MPQFVIHIYFGCWVLLLLLQPYGECDLGWGYLTHRVRWLIDHVITWYVNKSFISTFAGAQFFTIQGSILLIYKQKLKSGKVTSFFPSQLTCERRSLFQDITWSHLSRNPSLQILTLFVRLKVTWGNSFAFKMLLSIFSLQEQSF